MSILFKDSLITYSAPKFISSLITLSFLLTSQILFTQSSEAFISQNMFGAILPNNPVVPTLMGPQAGFGYGGNPGFGYGGTQNSFTTGLLGILPQVLSLGSLFSSSPNTGYGSGYGNGYGDSIIGDRSYGYDQGYGSNFDSTVDSDPFGLGLDSYDDQGYGSDSTGYDLDIPSEDLRDMDSLSGGNYFSDSTEDSSESLFGDLFSWYI